MATPYVEEYREQLTQSITELREQMAKNDGLAEELKTKLMGVYETLNKAFTKASTAPNIPSSHSPNTSQTSPRRHLTPHVPLPPLFLLHARSLTHNNITYMHFPSTSSDKG